MQAGQPVELQPEARPSPRDRLGAAARASGPPALQAVMGLLLFLLLIGVIRSQPALVLLVSLLLLAVLVSAAWSHRSREHLAYRRYFEPPRIFPGEETDYVIEITNKKGLPLPWADLEEHMPAA